MGGVKQRWLELEQKHISNVPDKNVCAKHFDDKNISRFIRQNYGDGFCDYCCKDVKVVPLEDLMEFIMDGIPIFMKMRSIL